MYFSHIRIILMFVIVASFLLPASAEASFATTTQQKKIKILIVAGHDNESSGTEYLGVREADMTVELAEYLAAQLRSTNNFDVYMTRDHNGYTKEFSSYFKNQYTAIRKFITDHIAQMTKEIRTGTKKVVAGVNHNKAPMSVETKLFGINKWANEHGVDLVLHIHFNDYPRKNRSQPGMYHGFTIYVPDGQYSNSKKSMAVAGTVFDRLQKILPVSNLPGESKGISPDQFLIAIGASNSLDVPAILIEYGYIYEPRFTDKKTRPTVLNDLAFQTSEGLRDYFFGGLSFEAHTLKDSGSLAHQIIEQSSAIIRNATEAMSSEAASIFNSLFQPH